MTDRSHPSRSSDLVGAALGVAAAGSIVLTIGSADRMRLAFTMSAYPLIVGVGLAWAWISARALKLHLAGERSRVRRRLAVLGLAIGVALATYLTVPHRFRVLYDEFDLLSTANAMSLDGTPGTIRAALDRFGGLRPLQVEVPPWRPLLYPAAVHALHTLVGVDPANAFRANLLVLVGLLGVAGIVSFGVGGLSAAAAAMLLVAACPTVALCASSGGFDLLALFLLATSLAAAYRHWRSPSHGSLTLVWAQLVALCHARYESPLFAALIGAGLVATRAVRWADLRRQPVAMGLTPVLLLPIVWQRLLQTGHSFAPAGDRDFTLRHATTNLGGFARVLTTASANSPFPRVALWIGLATLSVALVALALGRGRTLSTAATRALGLSAVIVTTSTLIFLAHFLGDPTAPTSGRFFLLPCVAVVLGPVVASWIVPELVPARLLLPYAIAMFAVYHPVAERDRITDQLVITREVEWARRMLAAVKPPARTLVIAEEPTVFTALGFSSVGFAMANQQRARFETDLARGTFDRIVVVQEVYEDTGRASDRTRLDGPWLTRTIAEIGLADTVRGRMLEVERRAPADGGRG